MITVAEINDIDRLSKFRFAWRQLWSQTTNASFFGSYDWLKSCLLHFPIGQKLRVMVVSEDGQPIGIVPFVVKQVESKVRPVNVLTYHGDDHGPFSGPIGPEPGKALAAALRRIAETERDWDMIDLCHIPAGNADTETAAAMTSVGYEATRRGCREVPFVKITSCWESYLSNLANDCQDRYLDAERQLNEQGCVSFSRYRPLGSWHGETLRCRKMLSSLELLKVNQRGRASSKDTDAGVWNRLEFMRDIHGAAIDAAVAEVNVLKLNGRAIAGAYAFHRDGVIEVVDLAFDSKLKDITSRVLFGRMLCDSFNRGDQALYLPLRFEPSFDWKNQTVSSLRYTHFANQNRQAHWLGLSNRLWRWAAGDRRTHSGDTAELGRETVLAG